MDENDKHPQFDYEQKELKNSYDKSSKLYKYEYDFNGEEQTCVKN